MVLATYVKHREAMNLEDPIDDDTLESVFDGLLGVLEPIRVALTKSYGSDDDLDELVETSRAPSQSASYEKSRASGGQKGFLRDVAYSSSFMRASTGTCFDRCDLSADPSVRIAPDLIRMQFFTKIVINGQVHVNTVVEYYGYPCLVEKWDESLQEAILSVNTGRPLKCEIYGILEPLKVRVISKGESVPYYGSKELQKRLHTILRGMDCFRLIGRPLCPTDLIDCDNHRVETGEGEHKWFSVDYSSATDCLSASLSEKILSYLIQDLPRRMQEIWLRVLAPHRCEYPPVKMNSKADAREFKAAHPDLFGSDEDHNASSCETCMSGKLGRVLCSLERESSEKFVTLPPTLQKNGQLMGSILSFPILCLANLGLYLEVIRDDPRPLSEKLRGVLVNGDDMLYVAPDSLWDRHVSLGERVGLVMTPGKAYKHTVFANANSTCFHHDLKGAGKHPWQINFLNTGLLFGQNKVLQKDTGLDEDEQSNAVSVINQLLKGALPGKGKSLFKSYLNRHKDKITRECAGRNLFIHTSLGGMGVIPPINWRWTFTERQRISASSRVAEMGPYADFGSGPRRAPAPREFMQAVHPYMERSVTDEGHVHSYNVDLVRNRTLIKTSLLKRSVHLVGDPSPFWRRAFYRSGLVTYHRKEKVPIDFSFDPFYPVVGSYDINEELGTYPKDDPFVIEFLNTGNKTRQREILSRAAEWSDYLDRCRDYSYQEVVWTVTDEKKFQDEQDVQLGLISNWGVGEISEPNFW